MTLLMDQGIVLAGLSTNTAETETFWSGLQKRNFCWKAKNAFCHARRTGKTTTNQKRGKPPQIRVFFVVVAVKLAFRST